VTTLAGPQPASDSPPGEKPKRIRNRRTKAQIEAERQAQAAAAAEAGAPSAEDLARCEMALAATFDILGKLVARKRGPHWALEKEESETLGKTWTAALAPYLPQIGAAVPWAAAAAVTWAMVQPRLNRDAELAQETPPNGPKLTT
jgi:type II secretory pathway pseudopilin PulG